MRKQVLGAVFFVAMVALVAVAPVAANAAGNNFYVVGKAGFGTLKDSSSGQGYSDMNSGFSGDIGLGYDWVSGTSLLFGIEATIGYQRTSSNSSAAVNASFDVVPFALTAKIGWIIDKLRIYAGAGPDLIKTSVDVAGQSANDTAFGGHILCGVTYDLTDQIYLGLEGKYLWNTNAKLSFGRNSIEPDLSSTNVFAVLGIRF
jgi:opacity protein-like surface antigen